MAITNFQYLRFAFTLGHACDFSEKAQKKGKIFKNLGKNVQNLKTFCKKAVSSVRI